MKKRCFSILSFLALLVCVAGMYGLAQAQTRDKYLISAKAGGINFVSGNVTVQRKYTSGQQTLTDKDNLESGDVVTTGAGGRVEVLLNPGSYLRVGENSEFELIDTSLEHLRVRLSRGSAIIEAVGTGDTELELTVETPQTSALIVKRGVYRINVLQTNTTEVLVQKGRALVGAAALVVKDGKMVVVGGGRTEIVKLDKKNVDSFDLWSRERAEYLASLNRQIQPGILNASLTAYPGDNTWSDTGYNARNRGVWVYDHLRGCYVFAPVAWGNYSSPYGYGYRNVCRPCSESGARNRRSNESGGSGSGNSSSGRNRDRGTGNSSDGESTGSSSNNSGGGRNVDNPSSTRVEPSQPSPQPSAPAYTPQPSAPSAPAKMEAPAGRDNPNE